MMDKAMMSPTTLFSRFTNIHIPIHYHHQLMLTITTCNLSSLDIIPLALDQGNLSSPPPLEKYPHLHLQFQGSTGTKSLSWLT